LQLGALVVNARLVTGDVHIGTQGVDDTYLVAARLPGFNQTAGRVELGIARQYRNFHDVSSTLGESIVLWLGLDETQSRIDDKLSIEHGGAAEQYAVTHGLAAGQGEVHFPALVAQHHGGTDDVPLLYVSVGTSDPFIADQSGLAWYVTGFARGAGMRQEAHPGFAIALEGLDVAGVQGGCPGTAVDLGANLVDAQLRQSDPF